MKIEPQTGEIQLGSGFVLSALTTRSQFAEASDEHVEDPLGTDIPRSWYCYKVHEDNVLVVVRFFGQRITAVEVMVVGDQYGTGWSDWSEAKELERKKANEAWLSAQGLTPGQQYPWGKVMSFYDSKGGFSTVRFTYTEQPTSPCA